jgi:hypothetical protein
MLSAEGVHAFDACAKHNRQARISATKVKESAFE